MTIPRPKRLRWLLRLVWLGLAVVLTVTGINVWMTARCSDRIHTKAEAVPQTNVALVLGTIKMIGPYINRHFRVRMDAAAELYHAGKIKHLLLSGDNSRPDYNEPHDMREALIERGVPATAITCDYAGLRTLDSIVRAREIFGVTRCIIISDDFHLARALWLADLHGVTATAYYNETAPWSRSWKTRTREWLARVRAVSDEITGKEPKFGGDKVTLPVAP